MTGCFTSRRDAQESRAHRGPHSHQRLSVTASAPARLNRSSFQLRIDHTALAGVLSFERLRTHYRYGPPGLWPSLHRGLPNPATSIHRGGGVHNFPSSGYYGLVVPRRGRRPTEFLCPPGRQAPGEPQTPLVPPGPHWTEESHCGRPAANLLLSRSGSILQHQSLD